MLEDLPDVPPAVLLLLAEVLGKGGDYDTCRQRLKALLPDLKQQSEVYEAASKIRLQKPARPEKLDIYLDGGLNLFDDRVGCRAVSCRVAAATRLARSIGLIADTVWITDYITEKFCRFGRVTNSKLDDVMDDIVVLAELSPLIFSGIVKFRSPWISACTNCLNHFDSEVDRISDILLTEFSSEFSLRKLDSGVYSLGTGSVY